MLGATGFLLCPWLPGTTNLWLIALLLVFILQLIQNMYYDTRIHGLQYMEIGWKQLGLTAVLAFICGILTAISCKEAYMQHSGAVFCLTAVTARQNRYGSIISNASPFARPPGSRLL